jgi:hypothetical protein
LPEEEKYPDDREGQRSGLQLVEDQERNKDDDKLVEKYERVSPYGAENIDEKAYAHLSDICPRLNERNDALTSGRRDECPIHNADERNVHLNVHAKQRAIDEAKRPMKMIADSISQRGLVHDLR